MSGPCGVTSLLGLYKRKREREREKKGGGVVLKDWGFFRVDCRRGGGKGEKEGRIKISFFFGGKICSLWIAKIHQNFKREVYRYKTESQPYIAPTHDTRQHKSKFPP